VGEAQVVVSTKQRYYDRPDGGWPSAILQSVGEAIVGSGTDGRIASWNPAAERLYGYDAAEVLGRSDTILVAADRRPELKELRARALAREMVPEVESEAVRKGGARFPVAITVSPIVAVCGSVIGIAHVLRDVSDRQRVEH
jgi:PAS domain S-box-containing protein